MDKVIDGSQNFVSAIANVVALESLEIICLNN